MCKITITGTWLGGIAAVVLGLITMGSPWP
jgi:hypothetical protein